MLPRQIESEYEVITDTPTHKLKVRQKTPEDYIAVDCNTGVAVWGPTRERALFNLGRDVTIYEHSKENRSETIVETADTLGGDPRVDGTRIGIVHITYKLSQVDSLADLASRFSGILTIDEAEEAVRWIEKNQDRVDELKREKELFAEYVEDEVIDRTDADDLPKNIPSEERPSFEEWKQEKLDN